MLKHAHYQTVGFVLWLAVVWSSVTMLDASATFGVFASFLALLGAYTWHYHTRDSELTAAGDLENTLLRHTASSDDSAEAWGASLRSYKRHTLHGESALATAPLYLAIGEPDSGLGTWLQHSGLTWYANTTVKAADTDWWFAKECIIVRPHDTHASLGVLAALARHREERPIDGVLVALRMEDLLTRSPARLLAQGQLLRRALETYQSSLHSRAPIYLVLTQCDALAGFRETFTQLNAQAREAVLGRNWDAHDAPIEQVVSQLDALMASVGQEALALMSHAPHLSERERIYGFADQLGTLRAPLMAWTNGFFGMGPGRSAPRLRGMYLTSAKQGKRLYDRLAPSYSADVVGEVSQTPYFTQQIFAQGILPDHTQPTRIGAPPYPRAATRFAWAAALVLVTLPWVSYVRARLRVHASHTAVEALAMESEGAARGVSLNTLNALRARIDGLQRTTESASWLNQQSGMSQDAALLDTLTDLYGRTLRDNVLLPILEQDALQMGRFAQVQGTRPAPTEHDFVAYRDMLRLHLLLSGAYQANDHVFDDADSRWLLDVLTVRWMRDQGTPGDRQARRDAQNHLRYFIAAYQADARLRLPRNGDAIAAVRRVLNHHNADFVRATTRAEMCVADYTQQESSWVLTPSTQDLSPRGREERAALCAAN